MIRIFLAALLCLCLPATATWAAEPLKPDQVQQIEQVVRDYLLRNPELLLEAIRKLEEREQGGGAAGRIAAHRAELYEDRNSFVAGNPQGDVTVVEFFDYRCPYCKQAHGALREVLARDPKVRVVLKELPILGPDSVTASRAAIAAFLGQREKYARFHEALMQHKGQMPESAVMRLASEAGLDLTRLKADMQGPKVQAVIDANLRLANALGVNGTPAFVIGDNLVPGALPPDQLLDLVKKARAGAG